MAVKIPQNAEAAIEMVLVAHLKTYLPEEDGGNEPNEQKDRKNAKKKISSCSSAAQPRPEQLAFEKCFLDKGSLHGMVFEALVASHAVWSEPCWKCKTVGSLEWCGGPDDSWRDLYCRNCQSCFEIKSKEDYQRIDKACHFDNLSGGSYQRWCAENFGGRVRGTDYIVFVSRTSNAQGWLVQIAEIGAVLPVIVCPSDGVSSSFMVQTCVTMMHRQQWFHIPGGVLPNIKEIFRRAFESVFPGKLKAPTDHAVKAGSALLEEEAASINTLKEELRSMEDADDWEDLLSDDDD